MRYTMKKSHYVEGYEPEMICIYLTDIQAAALYSQMLITPHSPFALGHFTTGPPAVHVHLENIDRVNELFECYGIIPHYSANKEYYNLQREEK